MHFYSYKAEKKRNITQSLNFGYVKKLLFENTQK